MRSARSRRSTSFSPAQAFSAVARISAVTAFLLLRPRGRALARTASFVALCSPGALNFPFKPRHLVSVDQLDSRRRTVDGACGPSLRNSPWDFSAAATSAGMPCAGSVSRRKESQRWWATNLISSGSGAGHGSGEPVAASDQASI
jgi:hypothetical protein